MNLYESIRVSLQSLVANKLRSLLTMLGIIIGVSAVIVMVSIGQGATASVTNQIQSLGSNLLTVSPGQAISGGVSLGIGSSTTLKLSDVEAIQKSSPSVKAVAPTVSRNAQIVYQQRNTNTQVLGTTPDYSQVRAVNTQKGRFFNESELAGGAKVCVLGPTVVQNLFGFADVDPVGEMIRINGIPFRIVGVVESKGSSGFVNTDDMILIPISTAQSRLIGNQNVRNMFIEAKSADLMDRASLEVQAALRRAHHLAPNQPDDFVISSQADVLSTFQGVTQTMTLFLGGVAAISLIVGGIGVMNIMLVSVTERTREIGIRKALGARYRDLLMQFLIEAVVLSLIGGVIGILLGAVGSSLVGRAMNLATELSVGAILTAFGFSGLIGIIFGVFPARKAAKLEPIDALRYE
ncbi:ABC transporter permease [Effusibacillus pohliae]|uniref:ABC transporter permease n=1 Tax=Effusibacillus pohliae TaxID=232270 RepID=UPI00035CD2A6|nr:ABC transporter permease [Effusibacillus pohliae]